jgi:hypothetical protein
MILCNITWGLGALWANLPVGEIDSLRQKFIHACILSSNCLSFTKITRFGHSLGNFSLLQHSFLLLLYAHIFVCGLIMVCELESDWGASSVVGRRSLEFLKCLCNNNEAIMWPTEFDPRNSCQYINRSKEKKEKFHKFWRLKWSEWEWSLNFASRSKCEIYEHFWNDWHLLAQFSVDTSEEWFQLRKNADFHDSWTEWKDWKESIFRTG